MAILIPVQYRTHTYPDHITPKIEEIAGHFDTSAIRPKIPYSLHTEYAYGSRKFTSDLIQQFPTLHSSHVHSIPQLWRNAAWGQEFGNFLDHLISGHPPPVILEIHPPFRDYCPSLDQFFEVYTSFEEIMKSQYPDLNIVIENRFGSMYSGSTFAVATAQDLCALTKHIKQVGLHLQIVLDLPQLFAAYKIREDQLTKSIIEEILTPLENCKELIAGIHIWGKKRSARGKLASHSGDLNTYFNNNHQLKMDFLAVLHSFLDDNRPRYVVPEVNGRHADFESIIRDLLNAGFTFQ